MRIAAATDSKSSKNRAGRTSHRRRGQLLAGLQGPLGRFFVMAKGFSLITVGLAVGAAWYLRNVAFPGEFARAADFADASPRPRGASRAAKTPPPRCSGTRHETWLAPNARKSARAALPRKRQNRRLPHTKANTHRAHDSKPTQASSAPRRRP